MLGLTRTQITHTLMAIGTGLGVFAWQASTITHNPWIDSACYAALAILGGLGVGVAKRSFTPEPAPAPTPPPEPTS